MRKNAPFLTTIGVDTAENGPVSDADIGTRSDVSIVADRRSEELRKADEPNEAIGNLDKDAISRDVGNQPGEHHVDVQIVEALRAKGVVAHAQMGR